MKCALVTVLLSIALLSQAFAVLRPLFPVKPTPPLSEELTVTRDELGAIDLNRLSGSGEPPCLFHNATRGAQRLWCNTIGKCVGVVIGVITETQPGTVLLSDVGDAVFLIYGKIFPRIIASDS
jgi:hypothetical protein